MIERECSRRKVTRGEAQGIAHGKRSQMQDVHERSVKLRLGDNSKYINEITCIK